MNLYRCQACGDIYCNSWLLDPCPSCGAPGAQTRPLEPEAAAAPASILRYALSRVQSAP